MKICVSVIDTKSSRAKRIVDSINKLSDLAEAGFFDREKAKRAELLLIHLGDDLGKGDFSSWLGSNQNAVAIYYGGYGGSDPRWERRTRKDASTQCIWRALDEDVGAALSRAEVEQLVSYARSVKSNESPAIPAVFFPPNSTPYLTALAVLCRGYTAWMEREWKRIEATKLTPENPEWWRTALGAASWNAVVKASRQEMEDCGKGNFPLSTAFIEGLEGQTVITSESVRTIQRELDAFFQTARY